MKPIKGLMNNTSIYDVPQGYVVMARNAINSYIEGSVIKEKGFVKLGGLPYQHIGTIETPERTFLFCTNNINSAICVFKNDVIETIIDDKFKLFKFNFSKSYPIKGIATKNYKNEWIAVWIDELNPIRLINLDNPLVRVEADLSLFPIYQIPDLQYTVQNGGSLNKGTYIPFIRYVDLENTYTDFIACGKPIYVGGTKVEVTGKQINIKLTNLDTRYKFFELGFYYIQSGVTTAIVLEKKTISESVNLTISNNSQFSSTGVQDLLVNSPFYNQTSAITLHENRLVLGEGIEPEEINLQRIANKIKIKVKSTLVGDLLANSENCKGAILNPLIQSNYGDGNIKTFIHGETYAFYFVGVLPTGRRTRGFIIPGRLPDNKDVSVSTFNNCRKAYEIENTAKLISLQERTFEPGYWENQDELYPNKLDYEENANKKVRHHVMPSIDYCRDNLYKNNKNYGVNTLDVLGIFADNVIIPEELKSKIVGYEIYYAKRTLDNQRFLGQSISLLGTEANPLISTTQTIVTRDLTDAPKQSQSTGGNWDSIWSYDGSQIESYNMRLKKDIVRLHSFDLLNYKPTVETCAMQNQLKLRLNGVDTPNSYISLDKDKVIKVLDYTLDKTIVSKPLVNDYYRELISHSYLPSQSYTDEYDNRMLETTFVGKLDKNLLNITPSLLYRKQEGPYPMIFEETYLSNLIAIKTNVYQSFQNQELIYTGKLHTTSTTEVMYCGDGFISDYSFVTYGLRETNDFAKSEGNFYIHRFICESNSNIALRYEEDGNIYSSFYPKSNGDFLKDLNRDQDPNQWLYDNEWNKVYDISKVIGFNVDDDIITSHYNRLIVSAEQSKEKGSRSIRTFLPLDYVELKKEKGRIFGLESIDNKLLIQLEHALLVSEGIRTLQSQDEVYIKSLDLTEQQFQEVFDDNVGIIGSRKKFSFYKTPLGQVIIDQQQNNVYIYKTGLKKLNTSLNVFFKDNLTEQSDNPYLDKGYIVNYDTQYDRLLFTQKGDISFTVSYSLKDDNWVSLHDYIPNAYIRQRAGMYNIKDNAIYKMNVGNYGEYYSKDIKPFYLDIPFTYAGENGKLQEFMLDAVTWLTQSTTEQDTFTHITCYNQFQCTNRITLYNRNWYDFNYRKLQAEFSFNEVRNNLASRNINFIDRFENFKKLLNVSYEKEWFEKDMLSDKVVIVRVEDDNIKNKDLLIQDVSINVTVSDR